VLVWSARRVSPRAPPRGMIVTCAGGRSRDEGGDEGVPASWKVVASPLGQQIGPPLDPMMTLSRRTQVDHLDLLPAVAGADQGRPLTRFARSAPASRCTGDHPGSTSSSSGCCGCGP
jgi:hypothetical protein